MLLGGRAARQGLSCSSCHLNGRGNPDFFILGVSGEAGTADVTLSLFSKVRGDGMVNPVVIPDIAARDGKQIKDRRSPAFRDKVHGLIVEEFDGLEPPLPVFEAVIAYLDTLDIRACADPGERVELRLADDWTAATAALDHAERFLGRGDSASAVMMARIARSRLERIHERLAGPGLAKERAALVDASREIEVWAARARAGQREGMAIAHRFDGLGPTFEAAEAKSLYNPAVLKAALGR